MSCAGRTLRTDRADRAVVTNTLTTSHHLLPTAHTGSIGLEVKKLNADHASTKCHQDCRSLSATQHPLLQATAGQIRLDTNVPPPVAHSSLFRHLCCYLLAGINDHASPHFKYHPSNGRLVESKQVREALRRLNWLHSGVVSLAI